MLPVPVRRLRVGLFARARFRRLRIRTSTCQTLSLTLTLDGAYVDKARASSVYRDFASGYSQTGSSEFLDGSFVTGTATQYSAYSVTNPCGYVMSTPSDRTY